MGRVLTSVGIGGIGLVSLPVAAQPLQWEQMSRMQLERQFAGPLRDTIMQRWRDPVDGTVCYVYLPITAQHLPPQPGQYVRRRQHHRLDLLLCIRGGFPRGCGGAGRYRAPARPARSASAATGSAGAGAGAGAGAMRIPKR